MVRVILLAALVPFLTLAAPARAVENGDVTAATRRSAVVVSAHMGDHRDAIGAGVVVGMLPYGIRVFTARHVTDWGDVTIWIDRHPYAAEVVRTFARRDLSLVDAIVPPDVRAQVRVARIGVANVATTDLHVWGESNDGPRLEFGTLTTLAMPALGDENGRPLLAFSCALCERGDSGGGVFDRTGTLVGILVARYKTHDGATLTTVAETLDPQIAIGDGP